MLNGPAYTADSNFLTDQMLNGEKTLNTSRNVNKELDKNAFMMLLITEMKNQNPLEPLENKEMMSQLASFSSLEQMENLNKQFESVVELSSQSLWAQAAQFMGKDVIAETNQGFINGKIEKATVADNTLWFEVNGIEVNLEQIREIRANSQDL
ncbi:MAG: flagellar biosynthesis protein FlgD [Candidatus Muirbacterium halophilum]|nr:flagellar biosynthesis protein FlgD [Candidatus Muirbacterium halophilum]MCK9477155.1 flagellar biosynthesis protein FlgD [Candidatus Muirbacterium halophilum]